MDGAESNERKLPNILVTGTPGTGKTSHCAALVEALEGMRHVDVNQIAKDEELFEGFDQERGVPILNDDKVCDALEERLANGGALVDTHSMIDYMPERWFDLVVVLTTDNTVLFDRLTKRGYAAPKVQENVQAEIMMVIQEEARSSYAEEMVQVLPSNTTADLESNVGRIAAWARAWVANNASADEAEDE